MNKKVLKKPTILRSQEITTFSPPTKLTRNRRPTMLPETKDGLTEMKLRLEAELPNLKQNMALAGQRLRQAEQDLALVNQHLLQLLMDPPQPELVRDRPQV